MLIYDQDCRDIISPLMNIGALRQKGVTLHMLLHTEREPVQDAPAVYFVRPTEANIKRIAEDCAKQLYRSFNLHFVTRIERPLLEQHTCPGWKRIHFQHAARHMLVRDRLKQLAYHHLMGVELERREPCVCSSAMVPVMLQIRLPSLISVRKQQRVCQGIHVLVHL